MNIKRPSIIFVLCAIVGIILAYNKINVIDKGIILSITFLLLLLMVYKKRLDKSIIVVCIIFVALYFSRYQYVSNSYDKIDNYVENNINKNDILEGVISGMGDSTNSSYVELSNLYHKSFNVGKVKCYYNPINISIDAKIGNKVSVSGKIYRFERSSNVGQFDNQNYNRSIGLSCSMYANDIKIKDDSYNKFLNGIYNVKCIIKSQVKKIFTVKNAGLFNCMITGDKQGLDKDQKRLFNENGIAHILAISGLHLSILGLGFFEILRRKLKLRTSAFIVSVFILLYGIFIDCSVTSMRAIIMLYIRFLSLAIGRTYDSKNTLYILASIFLFINPYHLFNVGFQFSYMAILSLNMECKFESKKLAKIRNEVKDWFTLRDIRRVDMRNTTIKIPSVIILTLFLFPITVYNYFTYPLYSLLLNLIVIPLMSIVLFCGLLGVVCSFFSIELGKFVVGIVHVIFTFYERLCLFVEKLPYHKLLIGKPSFISIIIFYAILFLIYFIFLYRNGKILNKNKFNDKYYGKKESSVYDDRKYNSENNNDNNIIIDILKSNIKVIFMSIVLISISMFFMIYQYQSGLKISCLSIGQGDSFVFRTKDKKVYTIDGGSTSNTSNGQYILSPNLKANQISTIEKAYISHIDADHTNAIQYILTEDEDIKIKEVVLPIIAKNNKKYAELVGLCDKNNVKVSYLKRGQIDVISDNMFFYCMSPSEKDSGLNNDVNQASMCLKLYYNGNNAFDMNDMVKKMGSIGKDEYDKNHNTMIFTGDMGKEMETEILKDKVVSQNLQSDILKVAHHGSRTSSSKKFVEKVNPKYAILSYGYKNSYNHPHKETMNTLKEFDKLKIYNTVESGEIDIYMDKDIKIREYLK